MYLRRQKYEQRQLEKENIRDRKDVRERSEVNASRSKSKFRDAHDELYEGHDAARELNRKMKELRHVQAERSRFETQKEQDKLQDVLKQEWRELERFGVEYEFIQEIVTKLKIFEKEIFNTHKNLQSQSLSVLVRTALAKIKDLLSSLPYYGYQLQFANPEEWKNSALVRASFREKKEYLFKNTSKIATILLQLYQQIALIYVSKGREKSEARSWRSFERYCSKIPEKFPRATTELSNLLTQLQDLDSVI